MKSRIVIGQSGGCTAVVNASLAGAILQARRIDPHAEILGALHGIQGILKGNFADLTRESDERIACLARTPAAALGSCRHRLRQGEAAKAVRQLARRRITAVVYIGGNDSADTAHRLAVAAERSGRPLAVIGVPKTIDNDLPVTDHTPGYGSAARYVACVVGNTGLDTAAMRADEPVKIIEVSGRNSGWLACAGAIGKEEDRDAPQLVWPPEVPFCRGKFLDCVRTHLRRLGHCVAVVAETVRDARGRTVPKSRKSATRDDFGHPRISGTAGHLCELVQQQLRVRARWEKMGTIGRTAAAYVSTVDRSEAKRAGAAAVRYALRGISGQEVVLKRSDSPRYRCTMGLVPLEEIANAEKRLPAEMFDPGSMLPTPEFLCYARPLIGHTLPQRFRLKKGART